MEIDSIVALGNDTLHGYAIQQRFAQESDGPERLLPGILHSSLAKIREWGPVDEVDERPANDDDPRRRHDHATALGRAVAAAEADRTPRLVSFARRQALSGGGYGRGGGRRSVTSRVGRSAGAVAARVVEALWSAALLTHPRGWAGAPSRRCCSR